MKKANYKIIFFNNSKGTAREMLFSRYMLILPILIFFFFNYLLFYFFADEYVAWNSNYQIKNHKENNKILIDNINQAEIEISNIKEKLATIISYDNEMRDLLKLPKIHEDVRELGIGGMQSQEETIEYLNYLLPNEKDIDLQDYFERLDFIERSTNLELLSYMEMFSNTKKNKAKLRHYPAIYPVDPSKARLSSKFGYRKDPFSKRYTMHEGDDFSAPRGTDVMATADGLVISSKYNGTFGNYIEISHGNGYKTVYGHLHRRVVKKGSYVVRGQKIGEVGNTGRSTANHLHYEVKQNNKRVNPSNFYFGDI